TSTNSTSSEDEGNVLVSVKADPGYKVSVRRVPGESTRRDSIEISIQSRPTLHPQTSTDSLRSAHSEFSETKERDSVLFDDDAPQFAASPPSNEDEETKEGARKKTYQSLFGGPFSEDPFKSSEESDNNKQEYQLSRRHSDFELNQRNRSPIVSPTRSSFSLRPDLPTISERREEGSAPSPEEERQRFFENPILKNLKRVSSTVSENSYFRADQEQQHQTVPPTSSELANTSRKLTGRFITTENLLQRLQSDIPRRARTTISSSRPPEMQVLKRGDRSSAAPPPLRRVGSQVDSPHASSEHLIFGERFTTPDRKGKVQDKTRDGVLEAWGELAPEPASPTRPPSIRRRQSLKLMDLEQKVETLGADNSTLVQEKANLEKSLAEAKFIHQQSTVDLTDKITAANQVLQDRNSQIEELNKKLAWYQEEAERLSKTNESLSKTNSSLQAAYKLKYGNLATRYERKQEAHVQLSREHSELQAQFSKIQGGAENAIHAEIEKKDTELALLRAELQKAREEVKSLERKVMARQSNRYLDIKDFAHFAASANVLFVDVQKWCDAFSMFSAGKRCVHVHRVTDDAVKERFENVMLDDRGVRRMLKDESRRPQPLVAIMMRLIWEFVFTRYLFGLEVEERQKLLSLERTLAEVGAPGAVHQWRATTLTLLSQRVSFRSRLTSETENLIAEIMRHLNFLLPVPPNHVAVAVGTLRALLSRAVTLAIEMRTQRAEYVMLRAPRPEYDDHGEVSNTVFFDSSRMRSFGTENIISDLDLERENASVKLVLFPLIIRRGNEYGEDYHVEEVVSKMVVIVNRPQLRSESRSSMRSSASMSSVAGWREELGKQQQVSRLTPITDHSPRTTPEKTRREESPPPMPRIPEQTIRLVERDMDVDEEPATPTKYSNVEKKRRVDDR
ncbi:hypothetical protein BDD12DRAFT_723005, partial [Trichophaea hybrida]